MHGKVHGYVEYGQSAVYWSDPEVATNFWWDGRIVAVVSEKEEGGISAGGTSYYTSGDRGCTISHVYGILEDRRGLFWFDNGLQKALMIAGRFILG